MFNGKASGDGFLSDYANLATGLLTLHSVTGEALWRDRAARLMDTVLERFIAADGLLRLTLSAAELPVQPVDHGDVEAPSGTSAALNALIALGHGSDGSPYANGAARALRRLAAGLRARPDAWPALLTALTSAGAQPVVLAANRAAAAPTGSASPAPGVAELKSTRDFIRVDGRADEAGARVVVTIAVDSGHHINANPATLDFLIPTRVAFNGFTPTRISYPEPKRFRPGFTDTELAVYEGDARIVAHFDAADFASVAASRATVTAQACNDTVCYPPSTISVAITK